MIIDSHVHLQKSDPGGDRLVAEADRLGIDKLVVFGTGGTRYPGPGNDECMKIAEKHPDRLIPFAHLELGYVDDMESARLRGRGFRGFKVLTPGHDLNDRRYWPHYEQIQEFGVPVLFHLGIVSVTKQDNLLDIDTARMRPIFLDSILRAFPRLIVWGAHLGNPWYEEAAMLCRWHDNLFFDLSGSSLKRHKPQFFGELLWWKGNQQYGRGNNPWSKILFGTDVGIDMMHDVMGDYQRLMDELELDEAERRDIMGENAARSLGIK
ncbi:MAG TPA: amidohydrolase family protein [Candidatus Brocadiia bacterium]|nr:amidohydrolase family protein [Candidatus Brocadiia bacterium]